MSNIWQLQEAKSKFSAVVDQAMAEGAQIVTRHGKKAVVILPFEQYERLTHPGGSLVQFLLSSPLANAELDFERNQEPPRDIWA